MIRSKITTYYTFLRWRLALAVWKIGKPADWRDPRIFIQPHTRAFNSHPPLSRSHPSPNVLVILKDAKCVIDRVSNHLPWSANVCRLNEKSEGTKKISHDLTLHWVSDTHFTWFSFTRYGRADRSKLLCSMTPRYLLAESVARLRWRARHNPRSRSCEKSESCKL